MSPIFQSKPTSEELRRLAHDLLAIRASRFSSGDATLFDDETQNARILSDGALACLQGAAELEKKDDARRSTDRRSGPRYRSPGELPAACAIGARIPSGAQYGGKRSVAPAFDRDTGARAGEAGKG